MFLWESKLTEDTITKWYWSFVNVHYFTLFSDIMWNGEQLLTYKGRNDRLFVLVGLFVQFQLVTAVFVFLSL